MGWCIIARRGSKSGKYGYTARQYQAEASTQLNGNTTGFGNCYYGDTYNLNPITGYFTIPNAVHLGAVNSANKHQLVGKYALANNESMQNVFFIQNVGNSVSSGYVEVIGTIYIGGLSLVAIRITDSVPPYTRDTIVGDEIRKNIT